MDAIMKAGCRPNKMGPQEKKPKHLSKETFYIDDARESSGLIKASSPGDIRNVPRDTNGILAGNSPLIFWLTEYRY
jgi:hypothetical protein